MQLTCDPTCVDSRWVGKRRKTCDNMRTNLSSTKVNVQWIGKRNPRRKLPLTCVDLRVRLARALKCFTTINFAGILFFMPQMDGEKETPAHRPFQSCTLAQNSWLELLMLSQLKSRKKTKARSSKMIWSGGRVKFLEGARIMRSTKKEAIPLSSTSVHPTRLLVSKGVCGKKSWTTSRKTLKRSGSSLCPWRQLLLLLPPRFPSNGNHDKMAGTLSTNQVLMWWFSHVTISFRECTSSMWFCQNFSTTCLSLLFLFQTQPNSSWGFMVNSVDACQLLARFVCITLSGWNS